jgi:hypothetical protein
MRRPCPSVRLCHSMSDNRLLDFHENRYVRRLQTLSDHPEFRVKIDQILRKADMNLSLSFPYFVTDLGEIWYKRCALSDLRYYDFRECRCSERYALLQAKINLYL